MGLVVDIVPNHVGVGQPAQNPWWWDVLRHGRDSRVRDVLRHRLGPDNGVDGKLALPVLGSDDDVAGLTVDGDLLLPRRPAFPIAPGTGDGSGPEVHDRQHYRLIGWRTRTVRLSAVFRDHVARGPAPGGPCGVRRQPCRGRLGGARSDSSTASASTTRTGCRIRRIPAPGCARSSAPDAWLVIEKILAADEPLDATLPIAGTTGYDALREIGGLFVDPTGEPRSLRCSTPPAPDYAAMRTVARELKAAAVTRTLASELRRLCRSIVRRPAPTTRGWPTRSPHWSAGYRVYRSDYVCLSSVLPTAIAETVKRSTRVG